MGAAPLTVLPRRAWGAEDPRAGLVRHRVRRITVHQSNHMVRSARQSRANFRAYQADHLARGWPDIAYHLLIDQAGNVFEGRPAWARGDTATDYDPTDHLLVMCDGAFGTQRPTEAQLLALIEVLAWSCARYRLSPAAIATHRDRADGRCPGRLLHRFFDDGSVRSALGDRLATGGVRVGGRRYRGRRWESPASRWPAMNVDSLPHSGRAGARAAARG